MSGKKITDTDVRTLRIAKSLRDLLGSGKTESIITKINSLPTIVTGKPASVGPTINALDIIIESLSNNNIVDLQDQRQILAALKQARLALKSAQTTQSDLRRPKTFTQKQWELYPDGSGRGAGGQHVSKGNQTSTRGTGSAGRASGDKGRLPTSHAAKAAKRRTT